MKNLQSSVGCLGPFMTLIVMVTVLMFGARPGGYEGGRNSGNGGGKGGCAWILVFLCAGAIGIMALLGHAVLIS